MMKRTRIVAVIALFVVAPFAFSPRAAGTDPATLRLLVQEDLVYQGAFRVPAGTLGSSTFNFGGGAMAYNPARDSLFIVGRDNDATMTTGQQVAEIGIPPVVNADTVAALNTASLLQTFVEPTEGQFLQAAVAGTPLKIGGLMVSGTRLLGTLYAYYDADNKQTVSHFARPLDLSVTGQVVGPIAVSAPGTGLPSPFGTLKAGFFSGYLATIPSAWQTLLGGPAITGQCCINISSRTSNGPGAFVFNPSDVGVKNPIPATPIEYYTQLNPLTVWNTTNPTWNGTTAMGGMVFPDGTRSLLYFGSHGTGPWCYGNSGDGTNGTCFDPQSNNRGAHAYPYVNQIWAYDANDLVAVKNGKKSPWSVKPYGVWRFKLPFKANDAMGGIRGIAFDRATQRIFVSQWRGDDTRPVIHVYAVQYCQMCPREAKIVR